MHISKSVLKLAFGLLDKLEPSTALARVALTGGDPSALADWGQRRLDQSHALHGHAVDYGTAARQATDTSWYGSAAQSYAKAADSLVSAATNGHAREVGTIGLGAVKLAKDVENLSNTLVRGQEISNKFMTAVFPVWPWGPGVAAAAGVKNAAWTAMVLAQAVTVGKDFASLLNSIEGHHMKDSWTPPNNENMVTPATPTFSIPHDPTPFKASDAGLQDQAGVS